MLVYKTRSKYSTIFKLGAKTCRSVWIERSLYDTVAAQAVTLLRMAQWSIDSLPTHRSGLDDCDYVPLNGIRAHKNSYIVPYRMEIQFFEL